MKTELIGSQCEWISSYCSPFHHWEWSQRQI